MTTANDLGFAVMQSLYLDDEADKKKRGILQDGGTSALFGTGMSLGIKPPESPQGLMENSQTSQSQSYADQQQRYFDFARQINRDSINEARRTVPDWQTQHALATQNYERTLQDERENFRLKAKQRKWETEMASRDNMTNNVFASVDNNNKNISNIVNSYISTAPRWI